MIRILFFGSTTDSVIVLDALARGSTKTGIQIAGVVTQPASAVGRKYIVTPTPPEIWARDHGITVLTFPHQREKPWLFADDGQVTESLTPLKPDLVLSASFGIKIPWDSIRRTKLGGLNIHPSLLPRWRGGDPVPWSLLAGDRQMGVSIVSLSEKFDEGKLVAQQKVLVPVSCLPDPFRTQLFDRGSKLLAETLKSADITGFDGKPQDPRKATYARRLSRNDGYIPWNTFSGALAGSNSLCSSWSQSPLLTSLRKYPDLDMDEIPVHIFLERMVRALTPWPGVWTEVLTQDSPRPKRLKILQARSEGDFFVPVQVQLEGKNPVSWEQFSGAYNFRLG